MKPLLLRAAAAVMAAGLLALAGCAAAPSTGHQATGVWGYVVAEKNAALDVSSMSSADELVVGRVLAPGDAWLVVHLNDNGKPGMRVGLLHVSAGETLDARVPLKDVAGDSVIVAVHADQGTPGEFDFDMENPTRSADRPYFVKEKELATIVSVR